jgi:hypothetical protein
MRGSRSDRFEAVIARSPCDEAIHSFFLRRDGLLRCARNDGVTVVIPRAGGGSSMPRLIDSIISVSGILDHPLSRAMTAEIFRGAMRPEFCISSAFEKSEGAGKTGCVLHPRSHAQCLQTRKSPALLHVDATPKRPLRTHAKKAEVLSISQKAATVPIAYAAITSSRLTVR